MDKVDDEEEARQGKDGDDKATADDEGAKAMGNARHARRRQRRGHDGQGQVVKAGDDDDDDVWAADCKKHGQGSQGLKRPEADGRCKIGKAKAKAAKGRSDGRAMSMRQGQQATRQGNALKRCLSKADKARLAGSKQGRRRQGQCQK